MKAAAQVDPAFDHKLFDHSKFSDILDQNYAYSPLESQEIKLSTFQFIKWWNTRKMWEKAN